MDAIRIVGTGAVFIDDIVLPDGQTHMGTLGGGTVHALLGAALWDERPGLSAFVGADLPPDVRPFLAQHLNLDGLIALPTPQARAWQIFEHDGTRRELHRVESAHMTPFISGTNPDHLPAHYRRADGYFLLLGFDDPAVWGDLPGLKLWEPNQLAMLSGGRDDVCRVLSILSPDVVSPNLSEARMIYGERSPHELLDCLLADGARAVALRMGRDGSLVVACGGTPVHVPAFHVEAVRDETGAGNTYNGAFLAGMVAGRPLTECAVMGTVAASFCVEQVGVIDPAQISHAERSARYRRLMLSL
ncbi:MAG: hypothetical protein EA396_04405 [Anaerolineaceae bacterium]|nr:MAG: hypothetical protein EA396_04405 [Anaerolineaceae bacterium]